MKKKMVNEFTIYRPTEHGAIYAYAPPLPTATSGRFVLCVYDEWMRLCKHVYGDTAEELLVWADLHDVNIVHQTETNA